MLVPIVDELEDAPDCDASGTLPVPAVPVEPLGFICAMHSVVAPANASVNSSECVFIKMFFPLLAIELDFGGYAPPFR